MNKRLSWRTFFFFPRNLYKRHEFFLSMYRKLVCNSAIFQYGVKSIRLYEPVVTGNNGIFFIVRNATEEKMSCPCLQCVGSISPRRKYWTSSMLQLKRSLMYNVYFKKIQLLKRLTEFESNAARKSLKPPFCSGKLASHKTSLILFTASTIVSIE